MRILFLYLLPFLVLFIAMYLFSRRAPEGEQQPDEETSNATMFLKILAIGGCVAVGLLLVIELN